MNPTPTTPTLPEPATGAMKVVAYLLLDQARRAIDDVEDYERVELVESVSASEVKRFDDARRLEKLVLLSDAQALAGEVERLRAVPEGDWLWCKLMDFCKKRGFSPANFDDLFAIVGEARALATQEAKS